MQALFPADIHAALSEALAVVFPTRCAGCDAVDTSLCPDCRSALAARPEARMLPCGLEVRSALRFEGTTARVLRALKEEGRTALAAPLGEAMASAWVYGDAVAVPIPPSRASLRRRGFVPTELLARSAGHPPHRLLRVTRTSADQRALSRTERMANVAHTLAAVAAQGRRVVLVDDVVTTGATLAEATRALRAGGADVLGAVTVAATPRRST